MNIYLVSTNHHNQTIITRRMVSWLCVCHQRRRDTEKIEYSQHYLIHHCCIAGT